MKTFIAILLLCAMPGLLSSGPVGSTSEWGIVVTPCACCGGTNNIQVHHIYPQHIWPERAHDTNNMICLCQYCHLAIGHQGNFTNAVTNLLIIIKEKKKQADGGMIRQGTKRELQR